MQEAKVLEKDSQKDYETLMGNAASKRTMDAKPIIEKEGTNANIEGSLERGYVGGDTLIKLFI
eukprot:1110258-Heterocapsa_arctica.AAC.2